MIWTSQRQQSWAWKGARTVDEAQSPDDELPGIAGIYVQTDRYRRLVGLEQQVRALLDALYGAAQTPEHITEALRLAMDSMDDEPESSVSLDAAHWELAQTLSALIDMSSWEP